MIDKNTHNPWKGLNYYVEGEVIYGRNSEIESLSQYIINNLQTVLYGKSGIGKSSILNAGIFPIARRNGLHPVGIRLDHNNSISYLLQIKEAIRKAGAKAKELLPVINKETETLWEYLHRNTFTDANGQPIELLLVFDQFEEIFTLQQNEKVKKDFFSQLADLINRITPSYITETSIKPEKESEGQQQLTLDNLEDIDFEEDDEMTADYLQKDSFHIVITLREDFLSYLERYTAYIPAMKSNRYALLPINEEQAADIIMTPREGLVSKDVAKLIIQKVTSKNDFALDGIAEIDVDAAVLSLYLSRLYIKKGDADSISAELVNQFSEDIIKDFYEESVADLPVKDIEKIEDELLTYDGRRNNVSRNDLIREGIPEQIIKTLVEDRKLLRQFSYQDDIRVEFMHDILCPIVNTRIDQRELARQQEEERKKQEEEKKRILLEEKAKRDKIEKEAEEERARLKAEAVRTKKRNRRRLYAIGSFFLLLLLGGIAYWLWYEQEYKVSYASITTKDGWPIGVGKPLDDNEMELMPVYYQLVRRGYNSKYTRVNILNSQKKLSRNKFYKFPLVGMYETEGEDGKAKEFALLQRQTAYWLFSPDNEGNISRRTAFSVDGKELYALQFFRASSIGNDNNDEQLTQRKQLWANFIDKDGKSLQVRDNGADRMRIAVDDAIGYYTGYQFFSETGTPQPNYEGYYGYRYQYSKEGHVIKSVPLDEFGDPIVSKAINYINFDEYGRWLTTSTGKAKYDKLLVVYTMSHRIDSLKFNDRGGLICHSENIKDSLLNIYYYDKGKNVIFSKFQKENDCFTLFYQKMPIYENRNGNTLIRVFDNKTDSVMSWKAELKEQAKGFFSISYFEGKDSSDIHEKALINSKNGIYHKLVVDTMREDNMLIVKKKYLDKEECLSAQCKINQELCYYNENDEKVKHVYMHDNIVKYAYLYEYDNGQVVSQAVAGMENNPVRYAEWDNNKMCYYKMKFIYNFSNTLVAIKGINEFGEESLITYKGMEYKRNSIPASIMKNNGDDFTEYGLKVYKESLTPLKNSFEVDYIRIKDSSGTWYKSGVRDGDLLISQGGKLKIARPNPNRNSYDILTFTPLQGDSGAEHYSVYFNQKEAIRYNQSINESK